MEAQLEIMKAEDLGKTQNRGQLRQIATREESVYQAGERVDLSG